MGKLSNNAQQADANAAANDSRSWPENKNDDTFSSARSLRGIKFIKFFR